MPALLAPRSAALTRTFRFARRHGPSARPLAGALFVLACLAVAAAPARADRIQVFSIQRLDDVEAGERLATEIGNLNGVRRAGFDKLRIEIFVTFADGVTDAGALKAIAAAGFRGLVGPGKGAYLPLPRYPAGADVRLVTDDGSAVGPLEKLRVSGKYTVLDVFASWCGPCRLIDARLRELCASRRDLAVRKLNLVDFDTPLAGQLGPRLSALPHLIVFTPSGKRIEFEGYDPERLTKALAAK